MSPGTLIRDGEAPPLAHWVDPLGRVACPAHAGGEVWAAMLTDPGIVDVVDGSGVHWHRLALRWAVEVVSACGDPVCDECRRGVRGWTG